MIELFSLSISPIVYTGKPNLYDSILSAFLSMKPFTQIPALNIIHLNNILQLCLQYYLHDSPILRPSNVYIFSYVLSQKYFSLVNISHKEKVEHTINVRTYSVKIFFDVISSNVFNFSINTFL